jgi:predicted DNA-binding transcriptional regulator AlpA
MRLRQVLSVIPTSKSSWYRGIQGGIYPRPVEISPGVKGWIPDEIRAVVAARIADRDFDNNAA